MSGIGFWELIILFLIGLIVLGPEKLPRVANQLGGWLGQARRMTRVMKRQLEDELNFEKDLDIKPPSREPSKQPDSTAPLDDDEYSPEHATDEPGSGVGDDGDDNTYIDDDELAAKSDDQSVQLKDAEESQAEDKPDAEKTEKS
ncbi:MAG: twin-arginine translocase subunit TatB [Gammaproteobacteria bacterium]|nr:MAG: twin-arginine translocase subunit TatB [Gammaproteobacteria bacterium]RLA35161.1 MAG: twin-arginine translocase subunit TatB [Gammaproteobacteria bacterium]